METSESAAADPHVDDRLELLERRLSDRVEDRVIRRIKQYVTVVSVAGAAIGTLLGLFGLKQVSDLRAAAEDAKAELRAFREVILPGYRAEVVRMMGLDRRLPYKPACSPQFEFGALEKWLEAKQQLTLEPGIRESFMDFARKNNICTLERVQEIFKHPVQDTVRQLYRSILDREPDGFGRFTWGFRLMRAYTVDDVRKALEDSEEASKLIRKGETKD